MIYTVEEVAIKLKTSKQTIYNKLKLKEYKDKTLMKQGKTMIDEELLKLIQTGLNITNKFNTNNNEETIGEHEKVDDIVLDDDIVKLNQNLTNALIEQLKETKLQLKVKDLQITDLNDRLKQEQELNKNNQILQLRQPQETKQLEEHFALVDEKLTTLRDQMDIKQPQKGFIKRMFKK
ncbi:hypothetical protein E4V42_23115 [Clostridium estertheticum]|uniref:Uncharacterized protein n=1 Tax=Clostridium estertheticum TaxID=238834 RepID=A0A5N7J744_9CLOT|nr:hypothetical protein [Clostridium estertheticum]MPQ34278.1 hypothetical protein [Clostridium estertheticum]MPQ64554.1 hypothetical protein [Clostridium estertheticum]